MKKQRALVAAILVSLVVGLGPSGFAEDRPQHVELLLKVHKDGHLAVLTQTLRAGALSGPRDPEFRKGFWALQAQDGVGHDVYVTALPDPRIVYTDRPAQHPTEPGRLAGQQITLEETVFAVRLPRDSRIKHLKVSRLKQTVARPVHDPRKEVAKGQAGGTSISAEGEPPVPLPEEALEHLGDSAVEGP